MLNFQPHSDKRGHLIAIEGNKDIPFEIKRVYYIYGCETGVVRGEHAHKTLTQAMICVSGSCEITLDNGNRKQTLTLSSPTQAALIEPNVWHSFKATSAGTVILTLASDRYDESEYIRDYGEFLNAVKRKRAEK